MYSKQVSSSLPQSSLSNCRKRKSRTSPKKHSSGGRMSSVMKELTMEPGAADCGVLLHCEKLALANQWKEAFDVLASYITSCASLGLSEIQHQQLHNLATILSKNQTHHTSTSFHEHVKNDWRSCSKCAGVLHQAVTLSCGHTYCGKCYTSWCGLHSCTKCGARPVGTGEGLKNNVTILNLVNKWWGGELKAVELKNEGNRKFLEGCYDEALDKYNAAVLLGESCFIQFYTMIPTNRLMFAQHPRTLRCTVTVPTFS